MKFRPLRAGKMDPVILEYKDGTVVLFSYELPVAAYVPGRGYIGVGEDESSKTTQERISNWTKGHPVEVVPYVEVLNVIVERPLYKVSEE